MSALTIDPAMFLPESIDKETAQFNEGIHAVLSRLPPTYTQPPQAIRDARERGEGLWPTRRLEEVGDRFIPGPAGILPYGSASPKQSGVFTCTSTAVGSCSAVPITPTRPA